VVEGGRVVEGGSVVGGGGVDCSVEVEIGVGVGGGVGVEVGSSVVELGLMIGGEGFTGVLPTEVLLGISVEEVSGLAVVVTTGVDVEGLIVVRALSFKPPSHWACFWLSVQPTVPVTETVVWAPPQ